MTPRIEKAWNFTPRKEIFMTFWINGLMKEKVSNEFIKNFGSK